MTETTQPAALIRCLTAKDDAAASKQTSRPDSQMMGPNSAATRGGPLRQLAESQTSLSEMLP